MTFGFVVGVFSIYLPELQYHKLFSFLGGNPQMICCTEVPLFTVSAHRRKGGAEGGGLGVIYLNYNIIDFFGFFVEISK